MRSRDRQSAFVCSVSRQTRFHLPVGYSAPPTDALHALTQEEHRAEDARITVLRGTELLAAMRTGTLSCERAVIAFCRRANAVGKIKTKSVTQEFYDEAVRAAKLVDERRGGSGGEGGGEATAAAAAASKGLLDGMPMSIKDAMHMKGAVSEHLVCLGMVQESRSSIKIKEVPRFVRRCS